jgi:hypothetical protein
MSERSHLIPSQRASPLMSPAPNERATSLSASSAFVTSTTVGMTKEKKAAEVAHRKGAKRRISLSPSLSSRGFDLRGETDKGTRVGIAN